jgi:metallo-beta-lactamase family protein
MDVRIKFLGATETVTGSRYILDIGRTRLMVDCGLFQGLKELRLRNWNLLPLEAASIDAVLVTHAHIDHIGYLPRLYKEGFRGKIYCTHASADLVPMMLADSAKLQEEEAEYAARKGFSKHNQPQPLYNRQDAARITPLLCPVDYDERVVLSPQASFTFRDSGHLLGAAMIELFATGDTMTKKIVFSGDLGIAHDPLLYPPTPLAEADVLLMESTYGDRDREPNDPAEDLAQAVEEAFAHGGCVVIPSFAVGRTQTLLHYLKEMFLSGRLQPCPVYVDSPMATKATALYERHLDIYRHHDEKFSRKGFFEFPTLHFCADQEESQRINSVRSGAIIISAGGMMVGGRVLHHLYHRLPRPQDTIVIVGYQGEGTRGRRILDGEDSIKIFGEMVPVRCQVKVIDGMSAHADQGELLDWASHLKQAPKYTFLVHGEKTSARAFGKLLQAKLGWSQVVVPQYLESFSLFEGI